MSGVQWCRQGGEGSYAIYCDDMAGDSDPAESDISAREENEELMLPVDDLRGASKAIVLDTRLAHSRGSELAQPSWRIKAR